METSWSTQRGVAFASRLMAAGRVCSIFPQKHRRTANAAAHDEDDLIRWLARLPRPAAVFAANDTRAHHAINACLQAGISVPDDVAILGCDNNRALCEAQNPTISSVSLATEDAGYRAAEALDHAMRSTVPSDSIPRLITYGSTGIILRHSTDRQYGTDILVRRAVERIRSAHGINLSVPALVTELKTSRRTLEMHFRRQTGKTLHAVIQATRLAAVKRCIAEQGLTVAETAERCGFSSSCQLSTTFRRLTGTTIRAFRASSEIR